MSEANGFSLIFSQDRKQIFFNCLMFEDKFAEPVPDFQHSRNVPLVCFVVSEDKMITHICLASRGMRAGTGMRRLNLKTIVSLVSPIKVEEVLGLIPNRLKHTTIDRFSFGGLFTPKTFRAIVEALRKISPESRTLLDRFSLSRADRINQISARARESLAYQQHAILTALSIADIDREELQEWSPPDHNETPGSFLDGLQSARIREDAMIVNDLMKLPGFDLIKELPFNAAIFESESERLTVILANRLPLEEQTGTDLIYFNESYQSFVMVQYKAMEKDKKGAYFHLPNAKLDKQIQSMDKLLKILQSSGSNTHRDGFRLNENPFFLKFCPRIIFQPDDVGLIPGMYFPLDYWKVLAVHPDLKGPKGGFSVTYKNVGRYIDNTEFINLVTKAWVGTNIKQSSVLRDVIFEVLETGKAIVLAVKANKEHER